MLCWIFEHLEQGLQATTRAVRKVLDDTVLSFRDKSLGTRSQVIWQFLHWVRHLHYFATHIAQKCQMETEAASLHFIDYMRRKVAKMNPDNVINMEQTPILDSYNNKGTLSKKDYVQFTGVCPFPKPRGQYRLQLSPWVVEAWSIFHTEATSPIGSHLGLTTKPPISFSISNKQDTFSDSPAGLRDLMKHQSHHQ